MERRNFIKQTALVSASFFIAKDMLAKSDDPIYGHGKMRYRMDTKWAKADPTINPVNDCHEFVQDKKGRIMLLTNETKNNVLVFDKSGNSLNGVPVLMYSRDSVDFTNDVITVLNKPGRPSSVNTSMTSPTTGAASATPKKP